MTNTLDDVLVKYTDESKSIQTTTVKNFLRKVKRGRLSEKEQSFYDALAMLYFLNNCNPPLFHSFPKRTDNKLTIDATTLHKCRSGETAAHFMPKDNMVEFLNMKKSNLLETLAHELKHAEQYSIEIINMEKNLKKNGLAYHQINYLIEAQAHIFGQFIKEQADARNLPFLLPTINKFSPALFNKLWGAASKTWESCESEAIPRVLENLYKSSYKNRFDKGVAINENDKDLDKIPEQFHMSDELKIKALEKLKEVKKIEKIYSKTKEAMTELYETPIKELNSLNLAALLPAYKDSPLWTYALHTINNDADKIDRKTYRCLLQKLITIGKTDGIGVNVQNQNGQSALMISVEHDLIDNIPLLIENGADVDLSDNDGVTPLMFAAFNDNEVASEELIKANADVNLTDKMGMTALMWAAENGNQKIVEKLLKAGAKIDIKNERGKTALDIAQERKNDNIAEMLKSALAKQSSDRSLSMKIMRNIQNNIR